MITITIAGLPELVDHVLDNIGARMRAAAEAAPGVMAAAQAAAEAAEAMSEAAAATPGNDPTPVISEPAHQVNEGSGRSVGGRRRSV